MRLLHLHFALLLLTGLLCSRGQAQHLEQDDEYYGTSATIHHGPMCFFSEKVQSFFVIRVHSDSLEFILVQSSQFIVLWLRNPFSP